MGGLLLSILIGALAGFLGSKIFSGAGKGFLLNLLVGVVGDFLGGWLFGLIGVGEHLLHGN